MIGFSNVNEPDETDLHVAIQKMRLLCYVCIGVTTENETSRIDSLSSPPPNLHKFILVGKLVKVPHWFCSLQSLTFLCLHWSRLEEDLLPHIDALPHLGDLQLNNAYVGKTNVF